MARRSGVSTFLMCMCIALASGCASSGAASSATPANAGSTRSDRTTITAEQIGKLSVSSLYDVVQRLHPEWLQARNTATISSPAISPASDRDVQVFLGSQHLGSSDMLRQMNPSGVTMLRYYTAAEAQGRFGNGNLSGVIQVVQSGAKP